MITSAYNYDSSAPKHRSRTTVCAKQDQKLSQAALTCGR